VTPNECQRHLCISIVSHGHKNFVIRLIDQLAATSSSAISKLIITNNKPEWENFDDVCMDNRWPFEVICICNPHPLGFGTNHNQAFKACTSEHFCVLNPDIELIENPFDALSNSMATEAVGCAYPSQISSDNLLLDFERELASPLAIAKRRLFKSTISHIGSSSIDWISGSFLVFKSSVFRDLNGFDERYFMYCEDVDICLRLQLAGYSLARAESTVIHHTQRRTLKNMRHLAWHLRSLFRLWNSKAYKDYKHGIAN
jgi:N-acetylglucosaminyl-diphospho-decaprenol L-rhamnosyltransferase